MIKLRKILLLNYLYILLFVISIFYLFICINIDHTSKYGGSEKDFIGEVVSLEYEGNKMTMLIKAKENLIATYYFDTEDTLEKVKKNLSLGDVLKLEGELVKPLSSKNFYSFSYPAYLKRKGVFYLLKTSEFSIENKNSNILKEVKTILRNSITNDKVSNYVNVFFLGNDTNFDVELEEKFQKLGISHLFALSGTQISFLFVILQAIFSRFKKNVSLRKLLLIYLAIFVYYFFIDSCATIDRAIVFSIVFSLNKILNLQIKPFFLILFSLSILFFLNPYYIYDIGFQYSTVISCTLILYMDNKKKIGKIRELLKVSWVSFLVSLPISLYHFSYINPLSIIYNLFYVPFINIIMFPLSMIVFFIPHLSFVLEFFINMFEVSVNFFSEFKFGFIVLRRINICFYFLYYLLIFAYLFFKKKSYIFLYFLFIGIILHYVFPLVFSKDALYMIDVGQGDCFLLVSNNRSMLIDTGGVMEYYKEEWQVYEKTKKGEYIVNFLYQLGITKLDYLVLTHGDYDHAGEALTIMDEIDVETVFFNNNQLNDLEKKIWNNSSIHYKLKEGDSFSLGNFNFLIISNTYDDENDSSLVIYSTIYDRKILFMGDASIRSEKYILNNYDISNVTILKVGHHGSRTSSSEEFIKQVNPTYALISAGVNNKFNHPHDEIVERLHTNGTIIYDIRMNGMVMFDFTNNKIEKYSS